MGGGGLLAGLRAGFGPPRAPVSSPSSSLARPVAGCAKLETSRPCRDAQDSASLARQLAAGILKTLFVPRQVREGGVRVMTPFLQTEKRRHAERKCLAQSQEAGQNSGLSAPLAPRGLGCSFEGSQRLAAWHDLGLTVGPWTSYYPSPGFLRS